MSLMPYQKSLFFSLLLMILGLSVSTLMGCSGPDDSSVSGSSAASGASAVVVDIEQTIQRLEPTILNELTRSNPFEPMIAIEDPAKNQPIATVPDAGTGVPTDGSLVPTTSALDTIKLTGVIYSPRSGHSMAILQVGADGSTQILQQGQSYTPSDNPDLRIQVNQITRQSVMLTAFDKEGKSLATRPCQVEALIGFKGKKSGTASATTPGAAVTLSTPTTAAPTTPTTAPAAVVTAAPVASSSTAK